MADDTGVIVLALGHPAYAQAAFNLGLSLRHHNPDLHLGLLADRGCLDTLGDAAAQVFDAVSEIAAADCCHDAVFCPGKAKLLLPRYASRRRMLYVDADSLCCARLDPLFEILRGHGFKSQRIGRYTQWTDAASYRAFFGVEPGQTINSSWIYFEDDAVFRVAADFFSRGFPRQKLSQRWGAGLPDELFLNAALETLGLDSHCDVPVMYFDFPDDTRSLAQIVAGHYFLTFYGAAASTRPLLQRWYDEALEAICARRGIEHRFRCAGIVAHKHVCT